MLSIRCVLGLAAATALLYSEAGEQALTTVEVGTGFDRPLWAGSPPGDSRIWVLEQTTRRIKVFEPGGGPTTIYLNLAGKANAVGNERGLLGMAFHPGFAENGHFFVNYTANSAPGLTVVERYTALGDPSTSNVADPASAKRITQQVQPFANHNAGALAFGPDGYLYVAFGDGGNANDPQCRAQNPGSVMGKMFRWDVDVEPEAFVVPPDNPFIGMPGYLPGIAHLGLRNPWRYAFDGETGALYIGDVGQNAREEVSYAAPGQLGLNFGWKVHEGALCNSTASCDSFGGVPLCDDPAYTHPLVDYGNPALGCTVVGGHVYRGCAMPELAGEYFYADYCSNQIWSFRYDGVTPPTPTLRTAELDPPGADTLEQITSFGVDGAGELLIVTQGFLNQPGSVWRIVPASPDRGLAPCQTLSANTATVSIANGGAQTLSLHPGTEFAGHLYWVLGSGSGTSPGQDSAGFHLPLNLDAYFLHTLTFPNVAPNLNSLGFLDEATGEATSLFVIPPGFLDASLAGGTLHHAYGVLDASLDLVATSNPVPVTFVP